MTSLEKLAGSTGDGDNRNFGVDFVIHQLVPAQERTEAEASFIQLIETLTKVGLATEVRAGSDNSLLIFTKIASWDFLAQQVYRSRLQDWLNGLRSSAPEREIRRALEDEPVTEAERCRIVYLLITKPQNDGGAGITPGNGQWRYIQSILPLHDHSFNAAWIKKWGQKYLLDQGDLDEIRDKFGEGVAFYFAFVQSYFRFLLFPSAFGLFAWLFLGKFSYFYALVNCLWSVVFFEFWKQKEVDMAVQWGVRGASQVQLPRPEFKWEYEAEDPVTGEPIKVYSPMKRIKTQLLQIPFALACIVVLGGVVVTCNSLEVYINEMYDGGGKAVLGLIPTILLSSLIPAFSAVLMKGAEVLTQWENYQNVDAYNAALIQKQFVLNFMTSYMALLFTLFVYIPFGEILIPFLNFWHSTAQVVSFNENPLPAKEFKINPARISGQMFYLTITAQIVSLLTQVVVPYVKRQVFAEAKKLSSKDTTPAVQDRPEEAEFLKRVREECELEVYDVSTDYRQMVIQFGHLSMFSSAWPLAACCFLVNNWVELRSDAVKIAIGSQRPIPFRADTIGPWLTALGFLSWLGSVSSAAIVFLCGGSTDAERGTMSHISAWGVLSSVMLAEHFYFLVQMAVRYFMSKFENYGQQKERKERFLIKKRYLEETLGQGVAEQAATPGLTHGEKITREALEEQERQASIKGHASPEDLFWQRQRGVQETITVGRSMIEKTVIEKGAGKSAQPSPRA
ncbi:unnamed protein product [Clonostachys solani]|uniref:Uncharacterized protein n=1 Tax=Clonostachys solani TaxID=160281 RepID=A0A9N9Z408_9HYPO|nr:unnamed protein product [Clonostachys solani]